MAEQNGHPVDGLLAGTHPPLLDRHGRPLVPGDRIYLTIHESIIWVVKAVTPVLQPNAPPGTLKLEATAHFISGFPQLQPIQMITRTLSYAEIQAAQAQQGQAAAPPADRKVIEVP